MTAGVAASTVQPLLDVERLVVGIRWRRRIWTSLALFGLLVGLVVAVLLPPAPTAVTSVLVTHADDQQAERSVLMATDVALCHSGNIAEAALKQINVIERAGDFLPTYQCAGLTPNVLQITASGTGDSDAVRRAQALAEAFIADHLTRTQNEVDAQVKPIIDRRTRLQNTLVMVDKTISSATDPAQRDSLSTARAGLATQILDLDNQAADANRTVPTVKAGTLVVDEARTLPSRRLRAGLTDTGVGLVLGLSIGLATAAVLGVSRDRPVLRRDIAAELGVSVIAQLRGPPRALRRVWHRPGHTRERRRVAATLAHIIRGPHPSISLLEIGCPGTAALLVLDVARQVATRRPVVIVADLSRQHLSGRGERADSRVRIVDIADLPVDPLLRASQRELQLGVGSVGPGTSWVDLRRLGAETLLVVRAGYATTLQLHTIARQLAYAEISPVGVVLVQPDPRDRSDGTLWDGLHTVLRERNAAAGSSMNGRPPVSSTNDQTLFEPSVAPDEK